MGVRNPCNGDNCGDGLEDGRRGEDDDEGEESATVEGRRAMSEWLFQTKNPRQTKTLHRRN